MDLEPLAINFVIVYGIERMDGLPLQIRLRWSFLLEIFEQKPLVIVMQEELEHGGTAYQKRKKVKKTTAVQMK